MLIKNFDKIAEELCGVFSAQLRTIIEFEGFKQLCDLGFDNGLVMWNGLCYERLLPKHDIEDVRMNYNDFFYVEDGQLANELRNMREDLIQNGLPLIANKPGHILVEYHIYGIYGMHKLDSSDEEEEEQFFAALRAYIRRELVLYVKSALCERGLHGAISASMCKMDVCRSDYATLEVDAKFCVVLYYS